VDDPSGRTARARAWCHLHLRALNFKMFLMERSPTDVHAAPHAAATADTAMNMATQPSPSIAQATGIRVRQAANATGPERPDNQTWTPRNGGYRNPNPAPSLAHHATLTGRCLKPTVSRSSPCVSGRMRSDFFKAAERLANRSGLRLTLSFTRPYPKRQTFTRVAPRDNAHKG
jgi:hypothetical protein